MVSVTSGSNVPLSFLQVGNAFVKVVSERGPNGLVQKTVKLCSFKPAEFAFDEVTGRAAIKAPFGNATDDSHDCVLVRSFVYHDIARLFSAPAQRGKETGECTVRRILQHVRTVSGEVVFHGKVSVAQVDGKVGFL